MSTGISVVYTVYVHVQGRCTYDVFIGQAKVGDFGLSRCIGSEQDYYRASKGGRWPVRWYRFVEFFFVFTVLYKSYLICTCTSFQIKYMYAVQALYFISFIAKHVD